jgi:hypothetical protein
VKKKKRRERGCGAVCPYMRQRVCNQPIGHAGPHGDGSYGAPPMDPRVDVPVRD